MRRHRHMEWIDGAPREIITDGHDYDCPPDRACWIEAPDDKENDRMTEVSTTLRSAYLAGPMRGYDEWNFPAFKAAVRWLRSKGWQIWSPAERDEADYGHASPEEWARGGKTTTETPYTFAEYMALDLVQVCSHDAVICLPNWENSQGARLEVMVANEIGHPVFEITNKDGTAPDLTSKKQPWKLTAVEPTYIAAIFAVESLDFGEPVAPCDDVRCPCEAGEACSFEREHVTDGGECWCEPEVVQVGADGQIRVVADGEPQWIDPVEYGEVVNMNDKLPEGEDLTGAMRTFDTGATRNREVDPDYEGFLSPLAVHAYGRYMHAHRTQADGTIRASDNWQLGITFDSFIKSATRHLHDLQLIHDGFPELARENIDSALAGLFFNTQGYMHFVEKDRIEESRWEEDDPDFRVDEVFQIVGYLTVAIPELHEVHPGDVAMKISEAMDIIRTSRADGPEMEEEL